MTDGYSAGSVDSGRFAILQDSLNVLINPLSSPEEISEAMAWIINRLTVYLDDSLLQAITIIDEFWVLNSVPIENQEFIRQSLRCYGDCEHLCDRFSYCGFTKVVIIPDLMVFE